MATIERNEIFDLAFRFITETQESIFLTGKAGTGKTTFLKYLRDNSSKNMVVAAPTGVAAINAGGVTLHSLFQLPLHPFLPTENNRQELLSKIRYQKQRIQLLRRLELLVIDEISMVRCDVLDAIDTILRSVRRNKHAAFGGVQVLYIGDLFQLPPVAVRGEWDHLLANYYATPFFFDSKAVKEQTPLLVELTTIYRQKESHFVKLLNKVRNNYMDEESFAELNDRYIPGFIPEAGEKYITLTSHNNQADNINAVQLQRLNAPSFSYKSRIEGEFPDTIFPAEQELVLKEGTQVMFIKNDGPARRYFNGKIGTVSFLSNDKITVDCDGEIIEVSEEVWEHTRYTLNAGEEKLEQKVLGRFFQYPLRLAWAITIHKSQGLTFDKVMIDAGSSFSSGQVYVALSRCTSLDGIVLLSKIPPTAIFSNEQLIQAHQSLTPRGSLAERFEGARQVFTLQLLSQVFLLEEIDTAVRFLKFAVGRNSSTMNEEAQVWVNELEMTVQQMKRTGEKFLSQVQQLMKDAPAIENNQPLQQRIIAAAGYFLPLLVQYRDNLQQHTLFTEYKETASIIDEHLVETMAAFNKALQFVEFCKSGFTVTGFLKYKLNLFLPKISISCYAVNKKSTSYSVIANEELFNELRQWRDSVCKDESLPLYVVANNSSLLEIATYLPQTQDHLQQLTGFGKARTERYGDAILSLVHDYCSRHGFETNMELKRGKPKKSKKEIAKTASVKTPSAMISLQLYRQGKNIETIATERGLSTGTVGGHLTGLIKTGEVSVTDFASEEAVNNIAAFVIANPDKKLSEIRSALNEAYHFTQIKAVISHLAKNQINNDTASAVK